MIVVDAGVEDGDRIARAAIGKGSLHGVEADDRAKISARGDEAVFENFDLQERLAPISGRDEKECISLQRSCKS